MAVDLGFIEKSGKLLRSRYFLSKIGGKPSWLDLKDLPANEELVCCRCNIPLRFLCQLYCPIDSKKTAFHRTIFVFLCLSKACFHPNSNRNFVVFRNQLPRKNVCYPDTPPPDTFPDKHVSVSAAENTWTSNIGPEKFGVLVCPLCGIRANLPCKMNCTQQFCSVDHQNMHNCGTSSNYPSSLIPEYGVSIEPDDESENESSGEEYESEVEEDVMVETDSKLHSNFREIGSAQDDPLVEQIFSECSEKLQDKAFMKFQSCIQANPEQVIRYGRDAQPLWLSEENVPGENAVPKCEYCGSCRVFEFQILPQLLSYLNLDQETDYSAGVLDWGTLAVYTCKESCDSGPAYKNEYLWKQDILT